MKYLICFLLFGGFYVNAQSDSWELLRSVDIKDVQAWDVDPMGKLIYARKDALTKLDTSFNVQFTQSIKSFGTISKIDSRHSLKTLIFSEDQQSIAFVDNTLTLHKGVKDLSVIDVAYATTVSYSAQTSRYWIFDGDNSKLILIDENRRKPQVMENLAGTLGTLDLFELYEIENRLLLFDKSKGIYIFDIYGTLIDFIETENAIAIHFSEEHFFYMNNRELIRINIRNRESIRIPLPESGLLNFRVLGNYVFFQSANKIGKYLLKKHI